MGKPEFELQLKKLVFEEQKAPKLSPVVARFQRRDEVTVIVINRFLAKMFRSIRSVHFMLVKIALREHFTDGIFIDKRIASAQKREYKNSPKCHLDRATT